MNNYEIFNKTLYDYTNGTYCGVLIEEHVMKKIAKLQNKYMEDVKRVLHDNIESVYPSMWTLYYPDGKQTNVTFIDKSSNVEDRIHYATVPNKPAHKPVVYVANNMQEAKEMAENRYKETDCE